MAVLVADSRIDKLPFALSITISPFDVVNDSVFLLTRDYMMSDFALNKKEESKGVYGKRTTLFRNHKFNEEKTDKFYCGKEIHKISYCKNHYELCYIVRPN